GPRGQFWAHDGCVLTQAAICPEIPSDEFMWAFREAVATAGHYQSAPAAMRFYDRLAREINDACASERIPCGPARATMMPVFHWRYLGDALRDAPPIGRLMLTAAGSHVATASSVGPAPGLAILADVAGNIDAPRQTGYVLSGWAASPSGAPALAIRSRTDTPLDVTATQTPGQDATDLAPGWSGASFTFRTNCQPGACDLVVTTPGQADVAIPLDDALKVGSVLDNSTLRVAFDYVAVRDLAEASAMRRAVQLKIAKAIGSAYAHVLPVLSALAVFGLLLTLARLRTRPVPLALLALAGASAVGVTTRLALLAYLDVTSIPADNLLYPSAASPFVIVFAVIGCWCLARAIGASIPRTPR
ncbi:MAG: hypothetical protein ABI224_05150, partial [Acetobacteraceae bacterium]